MWAYPRETSRGEPGVVHLIHSNTASFHSRKGYVTETRWFGLPGKIVVVPLLSISFKLKFCSQFSGRGAERKLMKVCDQ